jgi:hypothetical protein
MIQTSLIKFITLRHMAKIRVTGTEINEKYQSAVVIISQNTKFHKESYDASDVAAEWGRSQWPCGPRRGSWPLGCWDRGFESRFGHGCLSSSFCVVSPYVIGKTEKQTEKGGKGK